jgi:hypothetical protein
MPRGYIPSRLPNTDGPPEQGMTQSDFSEMLGLYASQEAQQHAALAERSRQEIAKAGTNAPQRVDAVSKWIKGTVGETGTQIIVAHELTQCGNDQGQLVPLVEAIANNLGRKPEQASADSGYCSEANLEALEAHGVDGYVAPGRAKHPTAENGKVGGPLTQQMRKKIDDGGFETPYRLRKQVVEPVFGQIKQARGFRQFLLRGVEKVRAEWAMICTAHNLLKLFTLAKVA